MEQAEALLEVARRERWPGIEVSAGYQQFEEGDSDAVAVGVSLALPLWDRRTGEQDAWKARIARAAADLEQASAEAATALAEARENADNARATLALLNDSELPLARSVADAATKSYEAGATGLLDLLDALDRVSAKPNPAASNGCSHPGMPPPTCPPGLNPFPPENPDETDFLPEDPADRFASPAAVHRARRGRLLPRRQGPGQTRRPRRT
ncbi:MAG: TolC family protein [Kiritimatiellia bacterium]